MGVHIDKCIIAELQAKQTSVIGQLDNDFDFENRWIHSNCALQAW